MTRLNAAVLRGRKLLLLVLLAASTGAYGAEEIIQFHSDIVVHPDSSMTVSETIHVRAENVAIKRGIYRDFPTHYKDRRGNRFVVTFSVQSVQRNDNNEAYHIKKRSNGVRVYIGRPDHVLTPGEYHYRLTYKTTRQLGYFKNHDELYWNVTGNGWAFPIQKASARVTLPAGCPREDIKVAGYTGYAGATGRDLTASLDAHGTAHYVTTRPLRAEEGLTLVLGWPKGLVHQISPAEATQQHLKDNPAIWVALLGAALLLTYFIIAWALVGRDPPKGTIIPRFEPPAKVSPAAARFLSKMAFDPKCLAAAVVSLAVKKRISLKEKDKVYTLQRLKKDVLPIHRDEEQVLIALLGSRKSISLKQTHHATIKKAINQLRKALEKDFDARIFAKNGKYLIPCILITLLTLIMILVRVNDSDTWGMGMWLTMWSVGVIFLLRRVITAWRGASLRTMGGAIAATLFALPFVAAEIAVGYMVAMQTSVAALVIVAIMAIVTLWFQHLLKAPTRTGRLLMDELEGFRMYLQVGETERLAAMKGPERTPELFEAFLPYALALDVEQEWAEGFADVLAQAAEGSSQNYSPHWYHGPSSFSSDTFTRSIGGAMASAIAASAVAPGSSSGSSGFSGGGSSGGGGGGGGGGGW